ncbi:MULTISPECIES: aldo/keto reductase [Myxococcus]|uniref:aldo/keto reductase n=1 Tax=Myxococcus TaxID=32 RepID=UPI0011411E60|nr:MULTISPECIES: aldo/keto reductase [Myxococcus]MCK8498557.1 aldo/keto reductase [Myxococcus fulvus]
MRTRRFAVTNLSMSALGFGALHLSLEGRPSREDAIALLHRALELGVTLFDTADSYCRDDSDAHHNERLLHEALSTYPGDTSGVIVATKGGMVRPGGDWVVLCEPDHLRRTLRESFEALGGKRPIELWQLHTVDPRYSLESCLAVAREAQDAGLVRHIGLSNVSLEQLQRARRLVPIVSVQNEYNPWQRGSEFTGVLACCESEGLAFFPWSPLGGPRRIAELGAIPRIQELARARGVSVPQLVLAWMMAKASCVVPIPGARRRATLEDSLASAELKLTPEEVRDLDRAAPHRRREL